MRVPILLTAVFSFLTLPGCDDLECGLGTVREDGVCVIGEDNPVDCGPGFVFDMATSLCRPSFDAAWGVCGPNTVLQVNDAGVPVCVGTGTFDCTDVPPCPAPSLAGRVSVCGRIYDSEDFLPLLNHELLLDVGLYNPIAFVGNPSATTPLETVQPDPCGYFAAKDVAISQGLTAVGINDPFELIPGASDDGDFRLTGIATPAVAGQKVIVVAFATRRTTEVAWTTSTGEAVSLATQGVYMPIYIDTNGTKPVMSAAALAINPDAVYPFDGAPTAGVTVVPTTAANDFYFTDSDPTTLTTPTADGVANSGATGPNGFGMLLGSTTLQPHTGTGPAGCTWSSSLAASVPGLIFVNLKSGTCI